MSIYGCKLLFSNLQALILLYDSPWVPGVVPGRRCPWAKPRLRQRDLFHPKQLDVEDQGGIGRNYARVSPAAVGEFWRDTQLALAAYLHSAYAFVPSLDHVTIAKPELKRFAPGAIKHLSAGKPAGVVDLHLFPGGGDGAVADSKIPVLKS